MTTKQKKKTNMNIKWKREIACIHRRTRNHHRLYCIFISHDIHKQNTCYDLATMRPPIFFCFVRTAKNVMWTVKRTRSRSISLGVCVLLFLLVFLSIRLFLDLLERALALFRSVAWRQWLFSSDDFVAVCVYVVVDVFVCTKWNGFFSSF